MDMANYISKKVAEHDICFRMIKTDFQDIDRQLEHLYKLVRRTDRTNTVLLLGGIGLLYLIAKLSSKVMALEAAKNEDAEKPKGE